MRNAPILLALLVAGCGARPATAPEKPIPEEIIEMDGIAITVVEGGGGGNPVTEAFDALTLFEGARKAFDEGRYDEAERGYGWLLELFPEGRLVPPALYNRGLALEALRQYAQAAAAFRRYAQIAGSLGDQRDGEFRWGHNLVRTGDHPSAVALYTRLLEAADLGPADRAEAYLRRGTSLLNLAKYGEAERDLKASLEQANLAYDNVLDGNELAAEVHFRRAEIYERLCADVRLKLPVEKMKEDLADKARFFRQAQHAYIDALNVRNPYWASASGLKLGELYENFYRDVLTAEVPADFGDEERRFYFQELRGRLRPLLQASLEIYEKNVAMSERIGADNEWVAETERRLERLRALLVEAKAAEAEIKAGVLPSGGTSPESAPGAGPGPAAPPEPPPAPAPAAPPPSEPAPEPSTTVEGATG
jgi:tetratricopeptide (TPR) repeat protein